MVRIKCHPICPLRKKQVLYLPYRTCFYVLFQKMLMIALTAVAVSVSGKSSKPTVPS